MSNESDNIISTDDVKLYADYINKVGSEYGNFSIYTDFNYCFRFGSFKILEYMIDYFLIKKGSVVYRWLMILSIRYEKLGYFYKYFPLCYKASCISKDYASDAYQEITDFLFSGYNEKRLPKGEKLKMVMFLKSFSLSRDLLKIVDKYLKVYYRDYPNN